LPGLAVLLGGMWVANLYYWGFNQYIIQRTLAAKSLKESQKGIVFAAFLKMIIPLIVVIPGIVAFAMNSDASGAVTAEVADSIFLGGSGVDNDKAYPWLIAQFVPIGLKGLVLAALTAAIVSSMASMLNSTATIFTMDLYKPLINPSVSESGMVSVGRISATAALIIAILIAPMLGNLKQAFQYIQEYTGLVSPGILAIFLLGLFWKKTTNNGAIWGALLSIPVALYFKVGPNGWLADTSLSGLFPTIPFMDQMGYTFVITALIIVVISQLEGKGQDDEKGIPLKKSIFSTEPAFNIGSFIVCLLLAILYTVFW